MQYSILSKLKNLRNKNFNKNEKEWRLGVHNSAYMENKKYLKELHLKINPKIKEAFYQQLEFDRYVKKHIYIYSHPFMYRKINTDTIQVINLTKSSKNIKINNETVNVIKMVKKLYNIYLMQCVK